MTNQNSAIEHQIRPEQLQEELGIKKDAYYAYLKQLGIKASKDSNGKAYLEPEQANCVRQLRQHVLAGGKIEEFEVSHFEPSALVKSDAGELEAAEPLPAAADPTQGLDLENIYREASEIAAQRLTAGEQLVLAMASQMNYEDLHPEARGKVDQVRAATAPKFNAQTLAADLLSQCRQRQQVSAA
ncbi:MAG: hypothetical protein F6J97_01085 [Leptolyngbya sp. SIO4C1]|nr:hypothetical protein [Leptolyngbya sp. SIO4C1]